MAVNDNLKLYPSGRDSIIKRPDLMRDSETIPARLVHKCLNLCLTPHDLWHCRVHLLNQDRVYATEVRSSLKCGFSSHIVVNVAEMFDIMKAVAHRPAPEFPNCPP
ncbi:unnamed protein product [Hymenolepis diminuta]|uniref:Uncharacterized protein n=1 Tax=Hymenolepis diminuta TaxID=6216 RepID=A0A0R3SFH0_HYMDI|nr:unnamed protein product [Hymenolepis diminuta]VUZ40646.1 unnamed protein product [Hymenolepis diminuta]